MYNTLYSYLNPKYPHIINPSRDYYDSAPALEDTENSDLTNSFVMYSVSYDVLFFFFPLYFFPHPSSYMANLKLLKKKKVIQEELIFWKYLPWK